VSWGWISFSFFFFWGCMSIGGEGVVSVRPLWGRFLPAPSVGVGATFTIALCLSLPFFLLSAPLFSFLCLVLRFGRIDSPFRFVLFIIACFSDTETSRQTGGPAVGMGLLGGTGGGSRVGYLFIVWYYRCVRVITLCGVEGVGGFECSFPPCVLAWWMQFRSWRSI
jgi:hypothetical protein